MAVAITDLLHEYADGEDRTFGGDVLFVDLVPRSSWGANLHNALPRKIWRAVSSYTVGRVGAVCEACGHEGNGEAHERWRFDEEAGTQSLARLVCLCHWCHLATHMGRAENIGRGEEAMAHLCRVRGWSRTEAEQHVSEAFATWRERNRRSWRVDMGALTAAAR